MHTSSTNGPPRRHAHRPARAGQPHRAPYEVEHAGPDGVTATVRFRVFHLGGNGVKRTAARSRSPRRPRRHGVGGSRARRVPYRLPEGQLSVVDPLETPLTLRTWVDRREGRKLFVAGTLHDGSACLCADLESLFIELKPGQP